MAISLIAAAITVLADIISKIYVASTISFGSVYGLIPGILNITNVSNDGIAFGLLDNSRWLFMLLTGIIISVLLLFSIFGKNYHPLVYTASGLVLGGGLGNFIDRIVKLGKFDSPECVVDFIDFCAFPEIWMWTFNIADAAVCIGVALFAVYLVFFDKKALKMGLNPVLYEEKKNGGSSTDE